MVTAASERNSGQLTLTLWLAAELVTVRWMSLGDVLQFLWLNAGFEPVFLIQKQSFFLMQIIYVLKITFW